MVVGALVEGAAGCILGVTNVTAKPFVRIYNDVQAGNLTDARAEWDRIYPLVRFLLSGGYAGGLKGAMDAAGRSAGGLERAAPCRRCRRAALAGW